MLYIRWESSIENGSRDFVGPDPDRRRRCGVPVAAYYGSVQVRLVGVHVDDLCTVPYRGQDLLR